MAAIVQEIQGDKWNECVLRSSHCPVIGKNTNLNYILIK